MDNSNKFDAEDIVENEERINEAYSRLFATMHGQIVMKDLMENFYRRSSICPGDPYQTHANEGAREVILYIEEKLNANK